MSDSGRESLSDIIAEIEAANGWDKPPTEEELAAQEPEPHRLPETRAQRLARLGQERVRFVFRHGPMNVWDAPDNELEARITHPALLRFAREFDCERGAAVLGPSGLGKTTAVAMAVRRWVRSNLRKQAYWCRAAQLSASIAQWRLGAGEAPEIERAKSADLLVIDEVGWERQTDAVREVVAHRYDLGRFTVITSERQQAELDQVYGESVGRRLLDTNGAQGWRVSVFGNLAGAKR